MPDNLTLKKRSKVMASIKGRDTKPELILWEHIDHRRFRRYPKIVGNPDIGNKSRKVAIFVDGCFWHGCPKCYKAPSTRTEYWYSKLQRNTSNDRKVGKELEDEGYTVIRLWEHEIIDDPSKCSKKVMEGLQ